jgi:GT2 family glycosyltransferase
LSVIIPTYRRPEALERLLEALRPQLAGRADREAVVVNDGTHDEAYAAIAERFGDVARYQALPVNRGQSAVRNEAARSARGAWLVFIDDDCVPVAWWLDWLEAVLADAPDVDVVGGPMRPLPGGRSQIDRFIILGGHAPKPEIVDGEPALLVTGNLAVRHTWFDRLGGFDERLRSAEDRDFTMRLRGAGARFLVDPSWYVWHDYGGSLRDHLRRFHHYGFWMPSREDMARLAPRTVPKSAIGWVRHVRALVSRNRVRWRGNPKAGPLFGLFSLLTELALDIGYARGRRAFADPARRRQLFGG